MKKIFFAMTVLAGAIFSSCTNEDIEVTTVGKKYNVSCTINTLGLYDTFGLSQDIRDNYLRKKTMGVGVMTYLYDAEGKLVSTPQIDCNFNLNPVAVTFDNLLEGDYTVVCVETLVNPDDDFKSEYEIIDTESLATVALQHDINTSMIDDNCVAVGSQTFHVDEADQSISIVPRALGSRILCYYYNFVGSEYVKVGIGTEVGLDRYFLDPSLSEDDHYYYGFSEDGWFHSIHAMNIADTEDYYGIAYVLDKNWEWFPCYRTARHEEGKWSFYNSREAQLECGKQYYIGFINLPNMNATASKLCESYEELQEFVNYWQKENDANASAPTGYNAPFYDWDKGSVKNVKNFMQNYKLEEDITASNLSLTYFNNDRSEMYMYYFANMTSGLFMSSYYTINVTSKEASSVLEKDGFILLSDDEDGQMFLASDFRTAAMIEEEDGVVCITYMDMNSLESNQRSPKAIVKQIRQTNKPARLSARHCEKNVGISPLQMATPKKSHAIKLMEVSK